MKLIAGCDIGNSTTEICIGKKNDNGFLEFLSSSITKTTGTKGTSENVTGIINALESAAKKAGVNISQIHILRLNEAAPVIGDTAMETITNTIVTSSSMLGHNPDTPAGIGCATGELVLIEDLEPCEHTLEKKFIALVSKKHTYTKVAEIINKYSEKLHIAGLILQSDEAVLVYNRLNKKIPIVDEVTAIDRIETRRYAAIEVAGTGFTVQMLSNPYGIATLLCLTPDETKAVIPIAKSLIGKQSAVVIKLPFQNSEQGHISAGEITIHSPGKMAKASLDNGAEAVMKTLSETKDITDISGTAGTRLGNMIATVKNSLGETTENLKIKDLFATDIWAHVPISGATAGETCLEKAVAVAVMVKTIKLPMQKIAEMLSGKLGISVEVAGNEAVMAVLGAMTTPGTKLPLAILDLGGGSTDAAILDEKGIVRSVNLAGAGELVTLIIKTELGISDRNIAENIKKYPLAKVESLYHIRLENGEIKFFENPLHPKYFGNVVYIKNEELVLINEKIPMEKIAAVRKEAKNKVFTDNAIRALTFISNDSSLKNIPNVVLVGGSAEDFEIPGILLARLSEYGIVCGRGNIRKCEGARNAVATGLVMSNTNSD